MKKLAIAIMLGLGVMVSGCGTNQQTVPQQTQTQAIQQTEGISLAKAIDLAKKGQFTPQKVKFEGSVSDKVFGDEPEIIVLAKIRMGEHAKFVHIHVTDPEVIKHVAKTQEEQKNNYVRCTGTIDATEIIFNNWSVEVK